VNMSVNMSINIKYITIWGCQMRAIYGSALAVAFMILTTGCASLVGDETQPISMDTPKCPGASCRLTNSHGTYFVKSTPDTVVIHKDYDDLMVTCEKDGKSENSVHKSSANGATYANIILGGGIGALVDGSSGAGYDYQGYLVNHLNCLNESGQPPVTPVSADTSKSSISPTKTKKVEDRLRELKKLQEDGLISKEEADRKRQKIIEEM